MNIQTQPLLREHHFYVSISKFIFHHPEHGIVLLRDPIRIKEAEKYGLSTLLLYGLTVVGLPIRWMTFTPFDQPVPFRKVLLDGWRAAKGLRGTPDILWINRHLAASCPELAEDMKNIGVRVEVADGKNKSHPASLRSAQHNSRLLLFSKLDENDRPLSKSLQALRRRAQTEHDFDIGERRKGFNSRKVEEKIDQWLTLPTQIPASIPTVTDELDWEPGPWLSSWETSLPPEQPRYFVTGLEYGCNTLRTVEEVPVDITEEVDLWDDSAYDIAAEIAKSLLACWPNPLIEIARCVGITLQKLQWFISGKAPLDQQARHDLEALLGIEYKGFWNSVEATGPYALVAKKPLPLEEAYTAMSGGGDANPCELVPRRGAADPSWRYVLINKCKSPPSIVMAPRGERITSSLPLLLLNYVGIRAVDPKLYRDVVSTCARACREPTANIREMKAFAIRYEEFWTDGVWDPGEYPYD